MFSFFSSLCFQTQISKFNFCVPEHDFFSDWLLLVFMNTKLIFTLFKKLGGLRCRQWGALFTCLHWRPYFESHILQNFTLYLLCIFFNGLLTQPYLNSHPLSALTSSHTDFFHTDEIAHTATDSLSYSFTQVYNNFYKVLIAQSHSQLVTFRQDP